MGDLANNEEIKIFREYLKIPSVHPDVDYEPCIKFLIKQAESLKLTYKIHYIAGNVKKPVFIATWIGVNPELSSIMLNSHMDVVPVFEAQWSHAPFAADIDDEGRIFARGSQDCKCIGMQYFGAIRLLKNAKTQVKRTLHVIFVPDEEIGGDFGMQEFVKSEEFRNLNVGFALDEGAATDDNRFIAYYAERTIWQINFKFSGPAGHGSFMLENTVGERLSKFLNKVIAYRTTEAERLKNNPNLNIGDVTTINLTMIKGGVQPNVVPSDLVACFDVRIAVDVDLKDFEKLLQQWCSEVGGGIEFEWVFRCDTAPPTKVDKTNSYWSALEECFKQMNLTLEAQVYMGGTDSQYLRELGIPAIGFSPMNNTPKLMHDHDEYLKADIYLSGIEIYKNILEKLLNL